MGATAAASALLKAGKLCKVADVAIRVAMVSERIAGGLSFAQNVYNIGDTAIKMYCKYGIMGESLGLDTVGEVLGIGLSAMGCAGGLKSMGSTSKELLELKELAARGGLCFVAGTKVKTPDGDKNIEDIAIGDEVYAYDAETGETGIKHVLRTKVSDATELAHVTIDGETIDATPTHPFYVIGYGFKPARELLVGEKVLLLNGETKEVEDVTIEHLDGPVKVYNFEVEDWHTYYVTEQGVLVHNDCGTTTSVSTGYEYWKKSVEFEGNKVYQRNDLFDPNQVSSWKVGKKTITGTNIERMAAGHAPIGYDGKSINLHHLLQTPDGPIVEVSNSFHKNYFSIIHMNTGTSPSLIDRNEFNKWARNYWMNRALDFK